MSVETGGTGISAVKIELLKLGNYVSWSSSMIAQLKSKGWWRIVHGDRVRPTAAGTTITADERSRQDEWDSADEKAQGLVVI